jgi:hypothetical protein
MLHSTVAVLELTATATKAGLIATDLRAAAKRFIGHATRVVNRADNCSSAIDSASHCYGITKSNFSFLYSGS